MMILTTDALMTSLCSDVILCVYDCALQVHVLQFTILYWVPEIVVKTSYMQTCQKII